MNVELRHATTARPLLCSVKEAARLLAVSPRTVWRWLDDGTLPAALSVKLGERLRLFRVQALEAWVAANCPSSNQDKHADLEGVVVEVLRQAGPLDAADLASALGVRQTSRLRRLLERLVEEGAIVEESGSYRVG